MFNANSARALMYPFDEQAFMCAVENQIKHAMIEKKNELTIYLSATELYNFRTIKVMLKARYFCSRLIDKETGKFVIFW